MREIIDIIKVIIVAHPDATLNDIVRGIWAWDDKISFRKIRNAVELFKIKPKQIKTPHSINVGKIIENCYEPSMTSDELIIAVWDDYVNINVGTISRHFYRIKNKNKDLSKVMVIIPTTFSYDKQKLFEDLMIHKVPMVYREMRRYGMEKDEIEKINEVNDKMVIRMW